MSKPGARLLPTGAIDPAPGHARVAVDRQGTGGAPAPRTRGARALPVTAEIDTLLRNLPKHLRAMTRFAFATGLRRGNVLRLRWKQIDLGRRVMHVKASEVKNRKTLGIPLNDTAIAIIREQIGKHDEFVFVYQDRPLAATVNTAWRNALKKSGIEDFHFHDTRHTWASLLIQNGVPKG